MSRRTAIAAMRSYLRRLEGEVNRPLTLLVDQTIERGSCFVFFYQSTRFVETGDPGSRLVGNAPVIVGRHDGSIHHAGTADPVEVYIVAFEKFGDPFGFR